ncbi:hypothetical protein ANN_18511 [Periplaneta americana]|uniref:Uncharacterized protein n=1 Tax=Periplaneta americana TaxID=6978 RepID=A0ABQ8SQ75_PERAM|nr:hypothetical protein ANN_18511 [Periplaneta americana]
MAGLCEGGNEPPGSLKATSVKHCKIALIYFSYTLRAKQMIKVSYQEFRTSERPSFYETRRFAAIITRADNGPRLNSSCVVNRTLSLVGWFYLEFQYLSYLLSFCLLDMCDLLDDRLPLLRHVSVRPAAGWSVWALHGL